MASFANVSEEGNDYLAISYQRHMMRLRIQRPMTGRHAMQRLGLAGPKRIDWTTPPTRTDSVVFLTPPFHNVNSNEDASFRTLGRRIILGEARWESILKIPGEFCFIPNYWEWLEDVLSRCSSQLQNAHIHGAVRASLYLYDRNPHIFRAFCEAWCPQTNSLHTKAGEISITLWDLEAIGGLPIAGDFYDETVPYADELIEDANDEMLICRHLLCAYAIINSKLTGKSDEVSLKNWISFWFKGTSKYPKSNKRNAQKVARPKENKGSQAEASRHESWSTIAEDVFSILEVPDRLAKKVYLAAFLSCWLCAFILPNKSGKIIRSSIFKPASSMASGRKIGLAIPVLAKIYRGLNDVCNSSSPSSSGSFFPAHFIYAWLAYYFGTHFPSGKTITMPMMIGCSGEGGARIYSEKHARALIHCGNAICWNAALFANEREQELCDEDLSFSQLGRLITIRPGFLTLRRKSFFVVEPYNPHRFSRQFGFQQRVPKNAESGDIRSATLEEGLKFWSLSVRGNTKSRAFIPSSIRASRKTTVHFEHWWLKVHGNYLFEQQDVLIQSTRKVVPTIDVPLQPEKPRSFDKGKAPLVIPGHSNRPNKQSDKKIILKLGGSSQPAMHSLLDKGKAPVIVQSYPNRQRKRLNELIAVENSASQGDHCWKRSKNNANDSSSQNIDLAADDYDLSNLSIPTEDLVRMEDNLLKIIQTEGIVVGNADEEHQESGGSVADPRSFHPASSIVSAFHGEPYILKCKHSFLSNLWTGLLETISSKPLDSLHLLEEDVKLVLAEMERLEVVDISCLKTSVMEVFSNARNYHHERSLSLKYTTKATQAHWLKEKTTTLATILEEHDKEAESVKAIQRQMDDLEAMLAAKDTERSCREDSISSLKNEISNIENQLIQDDKNREVLQSLEAQLKSRREELVKCKLFP